MCRAVSAGIGDVKNSQKCEHRGCAVEVRGQPVAAIAVQQSKQSGVLGAQSLGLRAELRQLVDQWRGRRNVLSPLAPVTFRAC